MTARETYAARDGVSLSARVSGSGPVDVLLLSGGPGCVNYLPEAPEGLGARCVAPDPRGVGASEGGPHDLAQALEDLEALRAHLDVRSWVVVGHSSGADHALAYAATHPGSVDHVVSVCGTGLQDDRSWHAAYDAGRAAEPDLGLAYDPEVHRALLDSWREWVRHPDLYDRIRVAAACDLTVAAAQRDIRPSWPLAQLAVLWKTPLRVLPDVGHHVWHERPHLWWDLVREVVAAHAPRPPVHAPPEDAAADRAQRHEILHALTTTMSDPYRLLDLVDAADDPAAAADLIRREWQLSQVQADAVLDVQLHRLTRRQREAVAQQEAELRPQA